MSESPDEIINQNGRTIAYTEGYCFIVLDHKYIVSLKSGTHHFIRNLLSQKVKNPNIEIHGQQLLKTNIPANNMLNIFTQFNQRFLGDRSPDSPHSSGNFLEGRIYPDENIVAFWSAGQKDISRDIIDLIFDFYGISGDERGSFKIDATGVPDIKYDDLPTVDEFFSDSPSSVESAELKKLNAELSSLQRQYHMQTGTIKNYTRELIKKLQRRIQKLEK